MAGTAELRQRRGVPTSAVCRTMRPNRLLRRPCRKRLVLPFIASQLPCGLPLLGEVSATVAVVPVPSATVVCRASPIVVLLLYGL